MGYPDDKRQRIPRRDYQKQRVGRWRFPDGFHVYKKGDKETLLSVDVDLGKFFAWAKYNYFRSRSKESNRPFLYIDIIVDEIEGLIRPVCDADKMYLVDGKHDPELQALIDWREKAGRQRSKYFRKNKDTDE